MDCPRNHRSDKVLLFDASFAVGGIYKTVFTASYLTHRISLPLPSSIIECMRSYSQGLCCKWRAFLQAAGPIEYALTRLPLEVVRRALWFQQMTYQTADELESCSPTCKYSTNSVSGRRELDSLPLLRSSSAPHRLALVSSIFIR